MRKYLHMSVGDSSVIDLERQSRPRAKCWLSCPSSVVVKAAVLLAPIIVAVPGLLQLVGIWRGHADAAGGALVLPMSVYMVFENRKAIKACPKSRNLWGLLLYALGLSLLLASSFTGLGLVTVLAGAVFSIWGWPLLRVLLLPVMFLLFMWPMPYFLQEALLPYLQTIATHIPTAFLRLLFGLPLTIDGYVIHLPTKALLVAPACSGLYSLWGSLQVAIFWGYIMLRTWKRRVILLLLTVVIAVFGNLLRVSITVLIHYRPELSRYTQEQYHGLLGWGVVFAVLLISLAIATLLERSEPRSGKPTSCSQDHQSLR